MAMIACHSLRKPLTHRDIKPENILVSAKEKHFKLADFDISSSHTKMMTVAGTKTYMAPKVLQSNAYTSIADVYSLGTLMYFTITSKFPFERNQWKVTNVFHAPV